MPRVRRSAVSALFIVCIFCLCPVSASDFAFVEARARELAGSGYVPPAPAAKALLALDYDAWRALRYRAPEGDLWEGPGAPLVARPFVPGFVFGQTAVLNVVEDGTARRLDCAAGGLDIRNDDLAAALGEALPGFAGFYLDPPRSDASGQATGIMGASYLHFRGRNARFGPYARPLVLDIATAGGEQVSFFREFWLVRPAAGDRELTVYALLDSPGLAGAYAITIAPGATAVLDVHARLFPRGAAPGKLGLAPLVGMHLRSERDGRDPADFRPEVHNCDGLLVHAGEDRWTWTPLKNPQRLAVSQLPAEALRGFGLLQRDGDFGHYQDLQNRYERASSLWVEPAGPWGPGRVELVEIPSSRDFHPNIMAYWVPADGAAATLDYRLYWLPPGAPLHDLGAAKHTWMERAADGSAVTFVIDFEGGGLDDLAADTGLTSVVEAPKEAPLLEKSLVKNDVTGGWRLRATFALPQGGVLQNLLSAREGPTQLPFAAWLKRGENLPDALTETWRYHYIP